jgi:spermidine synthase
MNNSRDIRSILFITGFVSSSLQFIMLREIASLCGGNEIITGLFLAVWLLLSSLGTSLSGFGRNENLNRLILFFAATPLISLALFIFLTRVMIQPGETPSLVNTLVLILLTLAPTAITSSRTFILLSNVRKQSLLGEPGNSFGLETIGSVFAGILSTAIVILFIRTFLFFFIIEILTFLALSVILYKPGVIGSVTLVLAAIASVSLTVLSGPDVFIRDLQFRNIKIHETFDTPYGNITKGDYFGEDVTFYDFRPVYYNNDNIRCEEDIHFGLLQSEKHDSVLLISGGLINHLPEIMKYKPEQVTYVEHDPGLIKSENITGQFSGFPHITVLSKDAYSFLKKGNNKFDAIIQLVPQPSTLSLNRYYSREYFADLKFNLNEGGIFVCNPLPAFNYVSDNYKRTLASIVNALKCSFRNVRVIPGNSLYVIASDSSVRTDFCLMSKEKGINNKYVNCDYFNDNELTRRSNLLLSEINSSLRPNTLLKPVASWYQNSLTLEKQGSKKLTIVLLLMLITAISVLKVRKGTLLIYSSSCALSGLAVTVIFVFQAILGNAHLLSAFILSLLFSGLATGAASPRRRERSFIFYPLGLVIVVLSTGLLANFLALREISSVIPGLLMLLTFVAGFFVGSLYRIMTSGRSAISTERVYGVDLSGSAAGYLLTGTILIPLIGIMMTTFILSGIILVSVFIVSVAPKL